MDKNIVALVRDDTKTVSVKFFPTKFSTVVTDGRTAFNADSTLLAEINSIKEYKYVTVLNLKIGDLCMVWVGNYPCVVEVQSVDEGLDIEPNAERDYKWIVAKIDTESFAVIEKQNQELRKLLDEAYRNNTRRQFRDVFLGSLDGETQQRMLSITQGTGVAGK